jgi:hypothetical protein
VLSEEKSKERNTKKLEKEIKNELESYKKMSSAEEKRDLRQSCPKLDQYLTFMKSNQLQCKK